MTSILKLSALPIAALACAVLAPPAMAQVSPEFSNSKIVVIEDQDGDHGYWTTTFDVFPPDNQPKPMAEKRKRSAASHDGAAHSRGIRRVPVALAPAAHAQAVRQRLRRQGVEQPVLQPVHPRHQHVLLVHGRERQRGRLPARPADEAEAVDAGVARAICRRAVHRRADARDGTRPIRPARHSRVRARGGRVPTRSPPSSRFSSTRRRRAPSSRASPIRGRSAATRGPWRWTSTIPNIRKTPRSNAASTRSAPISDEHGTASQRLYNTLCIAYGGDPATFQDFVDSGWLPPERAKNCAKEYQQIKFAFEKTILPFVDQEQMAKVRDRQWFQPVELQEK